MEGNATASSSEECGASQPDIEDLGRKLYPAVPYYGTCLVRNLTPGETKKWCTCGMLPSNCSINQAAFQHID
jgi:hypothetical protein